MIDKLSDEYFDAFGPPNPSKPFSLVEDYRFKKVFKRLSAGSVLDVGVYDGDFLLLARKENREIFGTEINELRVRLANEVLGQEIVRLDFRNGHLDSFDDNSIDNVICMEVVEHTPDDKFAVSELCRVARKRVIITVPFQEKIRSLLCVHCNQYTPYSGHLHSYDSNSFKSMIPQNWKIIFLKPFGHKIIMRIFRMTRMQMLLPVIQLLDLIPIGKPAWLLVVIDNNE